MESQENDKPKRGRPRVTRQQTEINYNANNSMNPNEPQPNSGGNKPPVEPPKETTNTSIPDDFNDTAIPNDNYNPFDEPVVQRDYTKPQVDSSQNLSEIDIPEPVFEAPKIDLNVDTSNLGGNKAGDVPINNPITGEKVPTGSSPQSGIKEEPIKHPEVSELDAKDMKLAAENMADMALEGYARLHDLGKWYVEVPEDKLIKMAMEGKIDLDMRIPISEDGTQFVTIQEFVSNYNKQAREGVNLDPEFVKKVRPVMIRVFVKKGIGMTDETYLMTMFAQDLVTKGAIVFGLKKQISNALDFFQKAHQNERARIEEERIKNTPKPIKKEDGEAMAAEYFEPEERE